MRRFLRYGAWGVGALALLLVLAVLALPELLDRPRIAAQIQARLSSAIKGEVGWRGFSVRVLPSPRGELRGLRVETTEATLTAEEVTVALRLWPLLTGNAEITSLELVRPVLRLTVVPAAAVPEEARLEQPDALKAYRTVMTTIVDALREFAPDTVVAVDGAQFEISVEGMPPVEFRDVRLRARTAARGVELEASAASRYWSSMKLAGRIRYEDLSSTGDLHLIRVQGQAWLDFLLRKTGWRVAIPDADLSARLRADASKALELELEGSAPTVTLSRGEQRLAASPLVLRATVVADAADIALQVSKLSLGPSGLSGGVVRYAQKEGSLAADSGFELSLAQLADYARRLAPGPAARLEAASGTLQGRATFSLKGDDWRAGVNVEKSDAAVQARGLPGPLRLAGAQVDVDAKSLRAERVAFSLPAGDVQVTKARYAFKDGSAAAQAQFDLGLAESLALARAVLPDPGPLEVIESAGGRLRGTAKAELMRKTWAATADIAQSDAQAKLKMLPAPLSLAGASVRATPGAIMIDRAGVRLLDATALASATITGSRVRASVSQASVGAKLIAWAWQTYAIAPGLEPKTPIQLAVPHFAWAPKAPLELNAEVRFPSGPVVGVDVAWSPEALNVRRAAIKDARSDVAVALRAKGKFLEGSYAGTLDSRTVAAMLKSAKAPDGAMTGKLDFVVDRDRPEHTTAKGVLKGENVDLSWLAGRPAKIERIDIAADDVGVRIHEASVDWAGQRATLRGAAKRTDAGPVVEAEIDSPGMLIDALLPDKPRQEKPAPAGKPVDPWPLPVTGSVKVRAKFVQYGIHKVSPLAAVLSFEREHAKLEVNEAFVCGLALPMTLEATPAGISARANVLAQQQKLEETAHCLSGEKVALSGRMDLRVDVRTEGRPADLVRNLKGTVATDVRDGEVMKFALIGNILSMQNVVALVKDGGPKLGAEGFPFRQFSAKGRLDNGRFLLDEGVFHSNAIGLGANGWVSLDDFQTQLTVLVAPLALLDEAVRKLPVLGYVVGGTFTSLPVSVTGDIRDPLVVPLGPRAITNELTGILGRTLSLPARLVAPDTEK